MKTIDRLALPLFVVALVSLSCARERHCYSWSPEPEPGPARLSPDWRVPLGAGLFRSVGTGSFSWLSTDGDRLIQTCNSGMTWSGWCEMRWSAYRATIRFNAPTKEDDFLVQVGAPMLYVEMTGSWWRACSRGSCDAPIVPSRPGWHTVEYEFQLYPRGPVDIGIDGVNVGAFGPLEHDYSPLDDSVVKIQNLSGTGAWRRVEVMR